MRQPGTQDDTDARTEVAHRTADVKRRAHLFQEALAECIGGERVVAAIDEDAELIRPQPSNQGTSHCNLADAASGLGEDEVTDRHAHRARRQRRVDLLEELRTVGQVGQAVDVREIAHPLPGSVAFGHVADDGPDLQLIAVLPGRQR